MKANGKTVENGTKLLQGTELTITVIPKDDSYCLSSLQANHVYPYQEWATLENGASVTLSADLTILAYVKQKELCSVYLCSGSGGAAILMVAGKIIIEVPEEKYYSKLIWEETEITIIPTPKEGFRFKEVHLFNSEIYGNKYYYSLPIKIIVKDGMQLDVHFEKITEGFTVTYPQPANGSIKIMNGATEITSGMKVPGGTALTVTVTPDENYKLETLTANGVDIKETKSFTVTGDTEVKAAFVNVSGITELQAARCLTLAPNPAKTNVTITLAEGLQAEKVTITDLSGKTVFAQPVDGRETTVNVSGLGKGVYLVRAGSVTRKLIVE